MAYDFSKPETQELYERTVRERQELLGCSRAQAEMLVAALMMTLPAHDDDGGKKL
jgi:hypothetical protein